MTCPSFLFISIAECVKMMMESQQQKCLFYLALLLKSRKKLLQTLIHLAELALLCSKMYSI